MTPILKNHKQIYFFLVNIIIVFIYSLTVLLIVMSYKVKNKQLKILWPISILKIFLPFFSVCLFGQSFLLLTTIFDCQNGFAYVSKDLICREGLWFSIDAPLAAIAMILHTLLALITNTLYYKSAFGKNGPNILRKTNCYPDIILLFTKIFIIILFILDDGVEKEHWIILFFAILITGVNTFSSFYYQNRQNKKLNHLNNIFCIMPFLGFCSLFIGKIFKFLGFNGSILLFFSWIIFGLLFVLFYKKEDIDFALINHKDIESPGYYLKYIYKFYKIVINKNHSRKDYTILKSLIAKKEEKCLDSQCPLKKYIENSSNEFEDIFPLLQYCEKLFNYGISKFPNDISLKINYAMFLIFEMNHNKKALISLNKINTSLFAFQDNYNIYRCKKLIDEYMENKNKNFFHSFEYNKKIYDFKNLVSKVTSLYYDFWTLIIINKLNITNNLDDLNIIGSEIIKLNKKIDEEYNLLFKIKSENYDLIDFYSYYKENILNNKETFKNCKPKIVNSSYNNLTDSHEIQFYNFDVNTLKEKDLFKYLLLSGNKKNLANILDISINLCKIFGYNKNELLGKSINYLIPELFHKAHNRLLYNFNDKAKTTFYKDLFNNDNYIPNYIEKYVYALTKSKFLIPIKLKIYFVQTEGNEFVYIAEVAKIKDFHSVLEDNDEYDLKCVVLTDENFYIRTFTPNCINQLKIDDSYINSYHNIVNYIKQIKSEYIKRINDVIKIYSLKTTIKNYSLKKKMSDSYLNRKISFDNISSTEKRKIRKDLIDNKYLGENEITWRINLDNNNTNIKKNENSIFKTSIINNKDNTIFLLNNKNSYEEEFIMEIKKIILDNELVGYYFIFNRESKILYNPNNFIAMKIFNPNEQRRTSLTKQKKYKYLFQIKKCIVKKNSNAFLKKDNDFKIKRAKITKKAVKFKSYDKEEFLMIKKKITENSSNTARIDNNNKKRKSNISSLFDTEIINEEDRGYLIISEDYIPECSFNFGFDAFDIYYRPLYELRKQNENILNEALKFKEKKKMVMLNLDNKKETKKSNDSYESVHSEYEEFSSSSSISSKSQNSSDNNNTQNQNMHKKDTLKTKKIENKNILNNKNNSENQKIKAFLNRNNIYNNFYKVNLNKIYFSIYDFNKDMIVDTTFEKTSKIENIIKDPARFSIKFKNSEEYPNIFLNKIIEEKKRENCDINNSKKEKITNDKIIMNKVIEAINKEYDEKNIIGIHKASMLLGLIIIICSCIFLYFEINSYLDSNTILSIIKRIIAIKYCNKIGMYFIRELTLLNMIDTGIKGGQYLIIPASNRTEYLSIIQKNILELFIESQSEMTEFIGTSFSISKKSHLFLTQTNLITRLSDSNLTSTFIENNILVTLVQLNSAFYNLASSTNPVEQNHPDLFNYIYNLLNNFGIAINILIDTYRKELDLNSESYQIKLKIQLIIYFAIFLITYIIALLLYSKVVQRKKNYINVFLNINFDFISYSINKCEQFINKFKLSEETKNQEEVIDDSNDEKASLIQSSSHLNDSNINIKRKSFYKNYNKSKKKFKFSNDLIFKIFFGIFLLIIYIYYYIYGFYYFFNLKKRAYNISKFYYHLQHYHLNIIEYFNMYREYLFDNGSIILNATIYENLIKKEKEIYSSWTDDVNNLTFFTKSLFDNKDIRDSLNKSLCSYNITDYFKSSEECTKEFGINFYQDINIFSYSFVDELRIKKNVYRVLLKKGIIIGNLTEYKTETWHDNYYDLLNNETNTNNTLIVRFRLDLFNDAHFHTMSNVFFINIILPCLNQKRKIIFDYLLIEGKQNVFYLIFGLFIIISFVLYIFYWIPMIRRLNKINYEIKNMMKIIPIHILMEDINIKNLLHINIKK